MTFTFIHKKTQIHSTTPDKVRHN